MDNRLPLLDVAADLADGTAVDWESVAQAITNDEDRDLLSALRLIGDIARGPLADSSRSLTPAAPEPSRSLAERPDGSGESWGPLHIIEHVGHGTFGDVYRAWDRRLDREVALKILRRTEPDDPAHATAVIQEGRLLARVRHPNVVTVFGAERVNGQVGVWMEFVHGRTLEEELRERGPFAVDRVISIGIELSGALATVHRAGLIHGDVKAQNVLCDRGGRLVLTDFGAGMALDGTADEALGELAATPLCVAPEVLAGESPTPRSDLYSLAVLLYHLLTGTYPVLGRSLKELREAHANRTLVPLHEARLDLRRDVAGLINRALDPNPLVRHETLDVFHAELERLGAVGETAQSGKVPAVRRLRQTSLALLLPVAASVVTLAVWRSTAMPSNQAAVAAQMAGPLSAQNFTAIEFPGAVVTQVHEISDTGAIVGSYDDDRQKTHGFLLMDGNFTTIDVPNAIRTRPTGMSGNDTVVGDYSDDVNGTVHGFLFAANSFSVIDIPNAASTRALAVNSSGTIVGDYLMNGRTHGFMLRAGVFTTIDVPGSVATRAIGLNDAGSIVGDYQDAAGVQSGFLFADNRFTTIRVPGSPTTQAFGVNSQGTVVGRYVADGGLFRSFSFRDNQVTPLDLQGAESTQAMSINSSGVIVGLYRGGGPPRVRGFMLTP